MYKPSLNPLVLELTKTCKNRTVPLYLLNVVEKDGIRYCAWCAENTIGTHKTKRYCSTTCKNSAWAWSNPQGLTGLSILLAKQGFKCLECNYDWMPIANTLLGKYGNRKDHNPIEDLNTRFTRMVKNKCPEGRFMEVDHTLSIALGGQSLGLENCRILCKICHRAKTKKDSQERARLKKEKKCLKP